MKHTGVTARGIITPIFRQGDDVPAVVCQALIDSSKGEGFSIEDGDIVGITESVVGRSQGNYATAGQIASDVRAKFGGGTLGIVFPILSRNRFSVLLKGIAAGCDRLYIQLSYPSDEVGNSLVSWEQLNEKGINPYAQSFDEAGFRREFGNETVHPFTGVDYIEYYKSFGKHIEIVFSNDPANMLKYTDKVLCCDIHSRFRTKKLVKKAGGSIVFGLDDILTAPVGGGGFNPDFGLLGSNMATEDSVKLFPRDCDFIVSEVQRRINKATGKTVEVLVYGDGCFKDPVGGIWEFADPVVSPAFTSRLAGQPSELKMKYLLDNELRGLDGEELNAAMRERILAKQGNLVGQMTSQGTTPRRYIDLIGSLCDLVSGSGDRGTPVIHIKNYFTNFASE